MLPCHRMANCQLKVALNIKRSWAWHHKIQLYLGHKAQLIMQLCQMSDLIDITLKWGNLILLNGVASIPLSSPPLLAPVGGTKTRGEEVVIYKRRDEKGGKECHLSHNMVYVCVWETVRWTVEFSVAISALGICSLHMNAYQWEKNIRTPSLIQHPRCWLILSHRWAAWDSTLWASQSLLSKLGDRQHVLISSSDSSKSEQTLLLHLCSHRGNIHHIPV